MIFGTRFELIDDFHYADISGATLLTEIGKWTLSGVGTPAMSAQPSAADTPGVVRLSTSATTNDTAILTFNGTLPLSQNIELVEFRIKRSTSSPNVDYYAGLSNTIGVSMGTVGRWVQCEASNGNNSWETVSAQTGTSKIDTQLQYDAGYQTFRLAPFADAPCRTLIYPPTGDAAEGGADHASANLISSGTSLSFGFAIKTESAIVRSLDIDYVRFLSKPLNRT